MTDTRMSWAELTQQLNELGLKLQLHFEQAAADGEHEDEDEVKKALWAVGEAVEQAFTALGAAARDDAVRQDVKEYGRCRGRDRLYFAELGDRFRSVVKPR